jgi:NlpC/P60 family putative phage cell wall peptidase
MNSDLVVAAAQEWLGTPYRHRASLQGVGCDCLGLLRGVWRAIYGAEPVDVPPYRQGPRDPESAGALQRAAETYLVPEAGPLDAGQVVLFRLGGLDDARHCAILISPTRFVHAQEHLGVVEANLTPGWSKRISGRFRFPD